MHSAYSACREPLFSEPKYELDKDELGKRFREIQKEVHPDKFANLEDKVAIAF
jgi:DnaJ-domain-containing protein 1